MRETNLISESSAKQILDLLLRHAAECNGLAGVLRVQTPKEEFSQYGPIIGAVMVAVYDEGLKPLFDLYPHLKRAGFP